MTFNPLAKKTKKKTLSPGYPGLRTASLLRRDPKAGESSGTDPFSLTLSSSPCIQPIISSRPSCTLMDRVSVICSFSLRSLTDLDRLS